MKIGELITLWAALLSAVVAAALWGWLFVMGMMMPAKLAYIGGPPVWCSGPVSHC